MFHVTARKLFCGDVEITFSDGTRAYFDKYNSSKPDYRHKTVVINCLRYEIAWDKL